MILTGKVVSVESGVKFVDKRPRATIRLNEADSMYRDIRVDNALGWNLDTDVEIYVSEVIPVPVEPPKAAVPEPSYDFKFTDPQKPTGAA